jgi:hypothetical protein
MMLEDDDKKSFLLDPQAKSFQLKGFRWQDTPVLVVSLALAISLITGFNFLAGVGLSLLGRDAALFICGSSLGFLAGVWIGERRALGSATGQP